MQFLKTLFWVIVAVGLVIFSIANWEMVTIVLWGGLEADVKLPVLVIGAFLLGFLPTFAIYRTRLWSLKRRLDSQVQPTLVGNAPGPAAPVAPTAAAEPEGLLP